MRTGYAFLAALSLSHALCASAWYYLEDEWVGDAFFNGDWTWETENDPTHGRVNYVSQTDAVKGHLSYVEGNQFIMRADDVSIIDPNAQRGRPSVRISSQKGYDDSIIVLDLAHMPAGCATWPAFWTLSSTGPWPNGGEIDIIEGVNENPVNQATLHTTANCVMPPDNLRQPQSGTTTSTNCDVAAASNQGCGVGFRNNDTSGLDNIGPNYGTAFNNNGGGYYAMTKSQATGIQVWFWARDSPFVPPEISQGAQKGQAVFPSIAWGEPVANFPMLPGYCDYASHFNAQRIVFDLTFCGDWAGSVWPQSSCASRAASKSCDDFVNNSPSSFSEAYWTINSLRVYTEPSS